MGELEEFSFPSLLLGTPPYLGEKPSGLGVQVVLFFPIFDPPQPVIFFGSQFSYLCVSPLSQITNPLFFPCSFLGRQLARFTRDFPYHLVDFGSTPFLSLFPKTSAAEFNLFFFSPVHSGLCDIFTTPFNFRTIAPSGCWI